MTKEIIDSIIAKDPEGVECQVALRGVGMFPGALRAGDAGGYHLKSLGTDGNKRPTPVDIYFEAEDVGAVLIQGEASKIEQVSLPSVIPGVS